MRIDSSGNLLVGTTDTDTQNNNAGSSADNGFAYNIGSGGYLNVARYNGTVAYFNRTGTDGEIVNFRKDGSTVGSIGNAGSDLYIASDQAGIRFRGGLSQDRIVPTNSSGSGLDGISSDRNAWAIEADNGRVRWQIDGVDDVNNRIGSTAPAVSDKFALFGFGSGEVQAVFRKGGLVYWNSSLKGARAGRAEGAVVDLGASPVIAGSRVYAAGASGRMVAMSLGDGERIWTNNQGVRGQLWPAGNAIFALNDMNQLIRVDASNGDTLWAVDLPNFRKISPRRSAEIVAHYGPVLAGGRILVASNDGLLRQFDPTDGALIAQTAVPGGATTHPVIAGGVLYLVSGDGQLHAFR